MSWVQYVIPVIVAGLFGIGSAVITAKLTRQSERQKAEREARENLAKWEREFPERYAQIQSTNRQHAEALRQQKAKAYLRVEGSNSKDSDRFFILDGATLTIGRADLCDFRIDDPSVSRQSALIEMKGGKLFLSDLNSTNGTAVQPKGEQGWRRVTSLHELHDGDRLRIGAVNMKVHFLHRNHE